MYQEEYKRWLAADLQDADLNPELSKIEGNDEEIKDRFAVALKFGTAGDDISCSNVGIYPQGRKTDHNRR